MVRTPSRSRQAIPFAFSGVSIRPYRQRRGVRHLDAYCRVARPARGGGMVEAAGATRLPHLLTPGGPPGSRPAEARLAARSARTAVNGALPGVMRMRIARASPGSAVRNQSVLEPSYQWSLLQSRIDGVPSRRSISLASMVAAWLEPRAVASGCAAWLGGCRATTANRVSALVAARRPRCGWRRRGVDSSPSLHSFAYVRLIDAAPCAA